MKAAEYVDIGQYLRDIRISLRVTLEDSAHALHIRAKYLAAIETGDLAGLPGKAYIRGYITNYAQYLGLDPTEVLEAYESLLAGKGQEFFIPEPTLAQNLPSKVLIRWSLVGLAALYGYWYFAVYDSTPLAVAISDVPAHFLRYLDKTEYAAMDRSWETCLLGSDIQCFIAQSQSDSDQPMTILYDIQSKQPPYIR